MIAMRKIKRVVIKRTVGIIIVKITQNLRMEKIIFIVLDINKDKAKIQETKLCKLTKQQKIVSTILSNFKVIKITLLILTITTKNINKTTKKLMKIMTVLKENKIPHHP